MTTHRQIDTSKLGPIRIPTPQSGQWARDILANEIAAMGSAWKNSAESVRSGGYSNVWVAAGLAGIERARRAAQDDTE